MANPMIFTDRPDGLPTIFHSASGSKPANCVYMEGGLDSLSALVDTGNFIDIDFTYEADSSGSFTGPFSYYGKSYGTTVNFGNIYKGGRVDFRVKFDLAPTSYMSIHIDSVSQSDALYFLRFNSTNKAVLYNALGLAGSLIQIGNTGTTPITAGSYHRICISHVLTKYINPPHGSVKVYIDGNLEITASDVDLGSFGSQTSTMERFIAQSLTTPKFYIDDVYIDDCDDLSDTGSIGVTAKFPNSDYINNFEGYRGADPSDRWLNVSQRPSNLANGWITSSGTNVDECYGIQSAAEGDVDLSGYSGQYPTNLPTVGVRSDAQFAVCSGMTLYDCGMYVAFSYDTNSILAYMSWVRINVPLAGAGSGPMIWNNGNAYRAQNRSKPPAGQGPYCFLHVISNSYYPADKPMIFSDAS